MADVMSIAASGMNDAVVRVANAAKNIANVQPKTNTVQPNADTSNDYTPTQVVTTTKDVGDSQLGVTSDVVSEPKGTEVDLAKEVVQMESAKISYGANAEIVKTANDMQRKMLDILA